VGVTVVDDNDNKLLERVDEYIECYMGDRIATRIVSVVELLREFRAVLVDRNRMRDGIQFISIEVEKLRALYKEMQEAVTLADSQIQQAKTLATRVVNERDKFEAALKRIKSNGSTGLVDNGSLWAASVASEALANMKS